MPDRFDDFNRADTSPTIGSPSDGLSAWIIYGFDGWGIYNNTAYCVGSTPPGPSVTVLDASESDVDAVAKIFVYAPGNGLCARVLDENNLIGTTNISGAIVLYKREGGTDTSLGTSADPVSSSDIFTLRCQGSSLTYLRNGTPIITATSTFNLAETKHGLTMRPGGVATQFDDFSITGLVGGLSIPVAMFHYRQQGIS